MPGIKLVGFSGEQPRVVPRLLPPAGAKSAINTRLDDGALTPYRSPTFVAVPQDISETVGALSTIYLHADQWLGWSAHVHAAPGPVADDRLYYTGDGKPKIKVGDDIFDLAVPRPQAAPTGTLEGSGDGDPQTRVYVYTYVTELGEESEPSPVSNEVVWQPGNSVVLSGIEDLPDPSTFPERGIVKQRFYRSQTGTVGTDFYFIAERDTSSEDFTDDIPVDEFAEPLPSRLWNAPPDDLINLTAMPNGMMAASRGKQLYFCEPYRPHAWPEVYVLTTDAPIVALAAMGSMLWVLTDSFPYRVIGNTPSTMVMEKVEANLPCVNAKGVVDLGHAIAWPSAEGLAAARGDGSFGLVSTKLFSPQDWQALNPHTMRAGQLNGRWIGSYDALDDNGDPISGSLIIDLSGESFLIRSSVAARCWHHHTPTASLFFVPPAVDEVRLFDSPTGDTDFYYWRSKQFVLSKPDNFGAMLIESGSRYSQEQIAARAELIEEIIALNEERFAYGQLGGELAGHAIGEVYLSGDFLVPLPPSVGTGVTVGVWADGVLVASIGTLDEPTRLPSGFMKRNWEIDVFGDFTIEAITMARTMDELKQIAGGP